MMALGSSTRRSRLPAHMLAADCSTIRSRESLRLLCVSTDGAAGAMDYSAAEFDTIQTLLQSVEVTQLRDQDATIHAVRQAMPVHRLLHITAHGELAEETALQSGFRLADGIFSVSDLAECDFTAGELAAILVCDAARGDVHLPNEALRVAGAAA